MVPTPAPTRPPWRRRPGTPRRDAAIADVAACFTRRRRGLVTVAADDLADALVDADGVTPRAAIRDVARRRGVSRRLVAAVLATMIDRGVLAADPRDDRTLRWGPAARPR